MSVAKAVVCYRKRYPTLSHDAAKGWGARVSAFPRRRIQPGFGVDLRFVVSARDIPVDNSDRFNYMFSFGPGIELYADATTSWRLEYFYRHVSNAHEGTQNPGWTRVWCG